MEITIPLPLLEIGCCDLHSDDSPTEMVLILPGKYNNSHKTLIMIIVMVPWHCLNEYYLVISWPRRCKLHWNLNFNWESARSKKICSEGDYFNTLRDSQNGRHFADLGDKGADWYLLFCCLTDTLKPTLQPSGPIFCLLLGVSSDYAQPNTGQVTEVTCPAIGRAQLELTPSKRQKTGPDQVWI